MIDSKNRVICIRAQGHKVVERHLFYKLIGENEHDGSGTSAGLKMDQLKPETFGGIASDVEKPDA